MQQFFPKSLLLQAALGIIVLHSPLSCAEEGKETASTLGLLSAPPSKGGKPLETLPETPEEHNTKSLKEETLPPDTYTINFNNVSIIEYIRFVSKITNLNFVFEEGDLQFNVTIVSEDKVSPRNILSILIQVLRIHDLAVLEQDNNILITKVKTVNQIATIVSSDLPASPTGVVPIVTRVFRIKNANLATVASIIKPMLSSGALLEMSAETRQLIVTDITTNVDKISTLLATIDTPHTSLEIDSYSVQNATPEDLIRLATPLIAPFAEGNPFIFVPHKDTSNIFIVSTPYLIERALTVLEDLDVVPKTVQSTYLYKLKYVSGDVFISAADHLADELKNQNASDALVSAFEAVKWIKESNAVLFTADPDTLAKIKEFLPNLDNLSEKGTAPSNILIYKIERTTPERMESALKQLIATLETAPHPDTSLIQALESASYVEESNSFTFTGDEGALKQVKEILPTFDVSSSKKEVTYLYKLHYASGEAFINATAQLVSELKQQGASEELITTLEKATWIKESNAILFTADPGTLDKVKEFLSTLDNPLEKGLPHSNFLLYKIEHASPEQIESALGRLAINLKAAPVPNLPLIKAIDTLQYIQESNSLVFTGTAEALKELKEILPTFDIASFEQQKAIQEQETLPSEFLIYHPKYRSGDELKKALEEIGDNLENAKLANPLFLQTIRGVKWTPATNSLIFTGNPSSLKRIEATLLSIDNAQESHLKGEVLIYKPKYVSRGQLEQALMELSENLSTNNPADVNLQEAIESMKWIDESQCLLFRASPLTIHRIKDLITSLDTPEGIAGGGGNTFVLYQLKFAPGDAIIANLQKVSHNLKTSNVSSTTLIEAVDSIRWIKDNNSLLLTGSLSTIEQIKKLIEQFDLPSAAVNPSPASSKSAFFIYKPTHQPAEVIEQSLKDLAVDLESSGLIDPDLLLTLQTMRYVDSTKTLLFTGSPAALEKVKELLVRVDNISSEEMHIQQLGQLTFFIYKIRYVPAQELITALKGLALDLQKTGAIDENTVAAINSMKWIKETNSILFTGSAHTLERVEGMVKKFDTPALAPHLEAQLPPLPPAHFIVYTPKYQPGDELIKILEEFEQNLVSSGVTDKNLFDTINNLKWIERTCSLLISGDETSIQKVEDLLRRFDVPDKTATPNPSAIESIENTSFLIYKLQYHQGDEILSALKQITADISKSGAASNQNLLQAINSLQWVKVTNSLLGSGEQTTLGKLKELIQNLDIPLRQVFIEILVIETNLTNTNNFGLQWGGRMQYLDKFAAATGNFPQPPAAAAATGSTFTGGGIVGLNPNGGLNAVNATTTPTSTPTNIPFMNGFDLGVIGDIIMHKGKSFISLGNLVNALQTDTDSTVVMNPKIITQDNRNSTIFVGNNIPFAGSLVQTNSALVQTSQNLEYRDIGFNLSITPTIGNSDIVTLDISNDISEVLSVPVLGTSNSTSGGLNGIQTSHTSMATRVHVPNDHFVVLSGMVQDTKSRYRSGIPCLGGLPVIGAVFSESDRLNSKQNVIIFVRPHIVDTYEEYKALTEREEILFKEQAVFPILKEEFDAGIDLIKTPDNE